MHLICKTKAKCKLVHLPSHMITNRVKMQGLKGNMVTMKTTFQIKLFAIYVCHDNSTSCFVKCFVFIIAIFWNINVDIVYLYVVAHTHY